MDYAFGEDDFTNMKERACFRCRSAVWDRIETINNCKGCVSDVLESEAFTYRLTERM